MTRLVGIWARVTSSWAWPMAVLAAVSAYLVIVDRRVVVLQEPLGAQLMAAMALYGMAWLAADRLLLRGVDRRLVVMAGAVIAIGVAAAVYWLEVRLGHSRRSSVGGALDGGLAVAMALALRGWLPRRAWGVGAVMALATLSSATFVTGTFGHNALVDAKIYLHAGRAFLDGRTVYLTAPLTVAPVGADQPFVYPPFTVPVFAAFALLPPSVGPVLVAAICGVSVVLGLRLLGVRWTMLPFLLLWPPTALGVYYGNMACVGFLAVAATWRFGAAGPLSGAFKAQSGLLSLSLVRDRRWRPLATGIGLLAALVLVTLPLTGIAMYGAWLSGLGAFETTVRTFPSMMGFAVQRTTGPAVAAVIAVAVVAVAFVGRRRDGLARMAAASIVASPTVYVHGLTYALPSMLTADAALAWGAAALMPWGPPWLVIGVVLALQVLGLTRARAAAAIDGAGRAGGRGAGAAHPLGDRLEPWPDRA